MKLIDKYTSTSPNKRLYKFDNGYGASVISTEFSYGGEKDLWELAVIKKVGDKYDLLYDTPITDDVIGWLTLEDVSKLLNRISRLKKGKY